MSENADVLVAHDTAESWLRRQGVQLKDETTDDSIIDVLINGASRAVQNEIECNLRPREVGVTKLFTYDGSSFLSLLPWQLDSVTSVVLHSDRATTEWRTLAAQTGGAEGEYRLEPRQRNKLGCYDELTLPALRPRNYSAAQFEVSVTGTWGVDQVPGDIEWLVLEIVRLSYPTPFASAGDEFGNVLSLSWLPRQLMEVLDAYRMHEL